MDKGIEVAALLIDVLSAYVLAKRIARRSAMLLSAPSNEDNPRHLRAV